MARQNKEYSFSSKAESWRRARFVFGVARTRMTAMEIEEVARHTNANARVAQGRPAVCWSL